MLLLVRRVGASNEKALVPTCQYINDARRLNIYCDADSNALNDVILDYFTFGHASDSDNEKYTCRD